MKLSFSPVRSDAELVLSKSGDVLTINGEAFDFTPLPDGATLPRSAVICDWLASDVERIDGMICLTLIMPHTALAGREARFPGPVVVRQDGAIPLPCVHTISKSAEAAQ
ncbi:MAG: hypothetical protein AAFS01_00045 [Pseudomonadota bacterium]